MFCLLFINGDYLDLSLCEEPRPDPEEDALVLLKRSDPALEDGAALRVASLQLSLELCQRPLPPGQCIRIS
jgi:hypothetical protein